MYTDNEILFPHDAIPALRQTRGKKWAQLIDSLSQKKETSVEVLALMWVMIELNGCLPCETDSYRAMRGCTACAQQTLRRLLAAMRNCCKNMKAQWSNFVSTPFVLMISAIFVQLLPENQI